MGKRALRSIELTPDPSRFAFFLKNDTFERLKVTEQRKGGERYLYRFKGPPQPWPANLIDSAFPIYFVKDRNLLFVVESNKPLAQMLEKLVRSK